MVPTPSSGESPASRDARFKILRQALKVAGLEFQDGKVGPPGSEQPAIHLKHGNHVIVAVDNPGCLVLVYPANFDEKTKDRLEAAFKKKRGDWERLIVTLRQELLQGRSGFVFEFEREGRLAHYRLEQKWVPGEDSVAFQRLLDGIQELVVAGMRGSSVLGVALGQGEETTSSTLKDPDPGMYS